MSIHRTRRARAAALLVAVTTVAATLAACGSDDDSGGGGSTNKSITVWIEEDLPDRVAATQTIVDAFTKKTGIKVELVAVAEDQFNQILTSNAAAGELPDVIGGLPLGQVRTLSANSLVDTAAVGEVIDDLDSGTFSDSALELTSDGDEHLAVPSESWVQLLLYRKDLFDKAGLAAPTTYDDTLAAAKALDSGDVAGFVGANVAGDAFTEQTFEEIGLGNDCQLVDDSGEVTFDSDECVEALDFYGQLQQNYSVTGAQDVDTTRASYFAGQAAMLIWSSFILDELAGLRNDALPTCTECADDPAFLAENSGVVTALQGPSGSEPATFGEITSWTITFDSVTDPAKEFVNYMMTDGYEPWIAIAPEGKIPVRAGNSSGSTEYADAWASMDVGVDTKAPLSQFYGPDVIDALTSGTDTLSRWAIPQGQGDLLGAIQGEQPVANAVNQVSNGADPADAAKEAADAISAVQGSAVTLSGPTAPSGAALEAPDPVRHQRRSRRGRSGRGRSARAREDRRTGYALISPTLVIVSTMVVLPILWTFSLAFQQVRLLNLRTTGFIGDYSLDNFKNVLTSPGFVDALVTTLIYSVAGTTCAIGLGLLAALALRAPFRGRGLVRACMLVPYVAPVVAATFVWSTMLNPQFGIVNHYGTTLLGWNEPIAFLSSSKPVSVLGLDLHVSQSLLTVVLFEGWRSFPFAFLFLTARMMAIPESLEEAATVDGATPTQRFRYIVLPQLLPTIAVLTVLRFIWTFNNFDDIYLLTGGGSGTQVVAVRVYDYLINRGDIGAAAAQALVLAAILAVLVTVYLKLFGRSEEAV